MRKIKRLLPLVPLGKFFEAKTTRVPISKDPVHQTPLLCKLGANLAVAGALAGRLEGNTDDSVLSSDHLTTSSRLGLQPNSSITKQLHHHIFALPSVGIAEYLQTQKLCLVMSDKSS